jgi:hypothetical protein
MNRLTTGLCVVTFVLLLHVTVAEDSANERTNNLNKDNSKDVDPQGEAGGNCKTAPSGLFGGISKMFGAKKQACIPDKAPQTEQARIPKTKKGVFHPHESPMIPHIIPSDLEATIC